MKRGLAGFDETAWALTGAGLLDAPAADRDRVIEAVQAGDPPGATWRSLPARAFFEDLLAAATEAFYAHPLAQEEIGYVGYADARGWQADRTRRARAARARARSPEPGGEPGPLRDQPRLWMPW